MATNVYHLTPKSSNSKVGPIAVTTASRDHCPSSCPMKEKGCYAKGGPLAIFWAQVTAGKYGKPLAEHLQALAALPASLFVRLHQAGDMAQPSDVDAFGATLADRTAWTYSHHRGFAFMEAFHRVNTATLERMKGLVVNLSANSLKDADDLRAQNAGPVCSIVPEAYSQTPPAERKTPSGARVVVCPQQSGQVPDCKSCGNGRPLCARPERDYVIAFLAHGSSKKAVDAIASEAS